LTQFLAQKKVLSRLASSLLELRGPRNLVSGAQAGMGGWGVPQTSLSIPGIRTVPSSPPHCKCCISDLHFREKAGCDGTYP
jgi:hypothetical protein